MILEKELKLIMIDNKQLKSNYLLIMVSAFAQTTPADGNLLNWVLYLQKES